jgi:adenylate cyclase
MTNVLIVDDQEENLKSYKLYLEDAGLGWNILTAKNENEAKEILSKVHPIEAIVTDLVMLNEQSGIELLRLAKQKDQFTMVLIITAFDKLLDRYQAFEMGAFDCISKGVPGLITGQEILVKVKTALQFRKLILDGLKTQEKILFMKRYFDPKILDTIDRNPKLLDLQSRTLTIVFWDIRGFSALCEVLKANPLLISNFLREYFKISSETIFKHNGVLDKFIGDGVMALFGALDNSRDGGKEEAMNAISASLELRNRFNELLKEWLKQWSLYSPHKIDIGLACGVHTGEALVGNVGTDARDQFTALGAHVNLTQRILSYAGRNQILLSATTNARVNGAYKVAKVTTLENVKNIPGRFEVFEALGPSRS